MKECLEIQIQRKEKQTRAWVFIFVGAAIGIFILEVVLSLFFWKKLSNTNVLYFLIPHLAILIILAVIVSVKGFQADRLNEKLKEQLRPYTCENAIEDINFFFLRSARTSKEAEAALWRAIHHMTKGTTLEKHNVSCPKCWAHYEKMKREHCGG